MYNPTTASPSILPILTWNEHLSMLNQLTITHGGKTIKSIGLWKTSPDYWDSEAQFTNDINAGRKQAQGIVVYTACVVKSASEIGIIVYYIKGVSRWEDLIRNIPLYSKEEITTMVSKLRTQYPDIKVEEHSIWDVWRNLFSPATVPSGYIYIATYIQKISLPFQIVPLVVYVFGKTGGYEAPIQWSKWIPVVAFGAIGLGAVYMVSQKRK